MRLTPDQIAAILDCARKTLGPDPQVWLFGSRVDDSKKGGDIDLYVVVDDTVDLWDAEVAFGAELWKALGDRKIDIALRRRNDPRKPIHEIAESTGVVM